MMVVSKSTLVAAGAGVAGALFLGYCIYFDHKRRSDPDFKRKLRERRARARAEAKSKSSTRSPQFPDFKDPTQMQHFFLQEVQLGEEMLAEGNFDEAAMHLSTAVTLCGQSQQLLQILQQTVPPQVFTMILERLPDAEKRLKSVLDETRAGASRVTVVEDADLE